MNKTIAIVFEQEHVGVFLFSGSTLIGGWMNQNDIRAADIAAEVLKVALPEATIIPMPRHTAEALDWLADVKVFVFAGASR